MLKDLLVNLSVAGKRDAAIDYAVALASAFNAHATAVAFAFEPVVAATVMGDISGEYIDMQRAENEKAATTARATFERAASLAGVAADSYTLTASVAGAADQFGRMARRFDLSVVMQADEEFAGSADLLIEAALFQSGRPTIVVPYIHTGGLKTDRIMVCWDAGRASARALGDAIPLLQRAKTVDVVMVTGEEGKRDQVPGADVGHHLARHGLNVEVKRIVAKGDVQSTLLSYAADTSADMVVMGGYGHSRLREFILGGVTRNMLASMTVPCLMSH
ncbi:MAG: universal stress protein [Variibacter sp.]|nr:universal stress protein [Variibacter sp.]